MISEPVLGAPQTSLSSLPDYHQAVFDTIPLPVFVVDNDVVLQDCNAAAGLLLSHDPGQSLHHRAGEALHCLHANDVPGGCGRGPSCSDCVLRRSVQSAFRGEKVDRVRAQMELKLGDKRKLMQLLITSSPFDFADRRQVVVVVEDVTDVLLLQSLLPICASCKSIRDDQGYWSQVDSYLTQHANLNFTHGLCPHCAPKYFPVLRK